MTTLDPGARVVLTHGLTCRPFSTAFFASRAAPSMTEGLEVLVQEVIEAITTAPLSISYDVPSGEVTVVGFEGSEEYVGSASANFSAASARITRSCGRFGPEIDGTTVETSSSRYSE